MALLLVLPSRTESGILLLLLGAVTAVSAGGGAGFDLLVAADVFVYLGELLHVLKAAAAVATDRCVHASSLRILFWTRLDSCMRTEVLPLTVHVVN
jgi:hypothetical protein